MSDDGRQALALIFMLGSVFSPRYAAARARGAGHDPLDFAAVNVAVYGDARASRCWALTERRGAARDAAAMAIGGSSIAWRGDRVCIDLDERTAPFPGRIRGRVTLDARRWHGAPRALDAAGRHQWWSIAPLAHAEVDLEQPRLRFRGAGYLDANTGDRALEEDFVSWSWLRTAGEGEARVVYDVVARADAIGSRAGGAVAVPSNAARLALRFSDDGAGAFEARRSSVLPRTRWRVERAARHEGDVAPRVLRTLEDTPFYARSLLDLGAGVGGARRLAMHESLDLDRFRARWVRTLLPFRMRTEAP